jgi:general secretion pathway protein I
MTRRPRPQGFTLIEMLAAVAVVAIAMGAIIAGMARFADNAAYLRQKTIALWVAHDRLVEFELQRSWPDTGKSNGEMEMAGASWPWQAEIQKTEDPHLRRVDVSVSAPLATGRRGRSSKDGSLIKLSGFLSDAGRE